MKKHAILLLICISSINVFCQDHNPIKIDKSILIEDGWKLVETNKDGDKTYFYNSNHKITKAKIVYTSGKEDALLLKFEEPAEESKSQKKGKPSKPKPGGPLGDRDQWPTVCKPSPTQTDTWICRLVTVY
jgi:hypothetical protein